MSQEKTAAILDALGAIGVGHEYRGNDIFGVPGFEIRGPRRANKRAEEFLRRLGFRRGDFGQGHIWKRPDCYGTDLDHWASITLEAIQQAAQGLLESNEENAGGALDAALAVALMAAMIALAVAL